MGGKATHVYEYMDAGTRDLPCQFAVVHVMAVNEMLGDTEELAGGFVLCADRGAAVEKDFEAARIMMIDHATDEQGGNVVAEITGQVADAHALALGKSGLIGLFYIAGVA